MLQLYCGRRKTRVSVLCHVQLLTNDHQDTVTVSSLNVRLLSNKYVALRDLIASNRLHFFAAAESWHESASCPAVIAMTPLGYRCIEKARPRSTAQKTKCSNINGGSICLFYQLCYSVRDIALPVYSMTESLAVYVQGRGIAFVIAILCRPPASSPVTFLGEFTDIIERIAVYSAPLYNIHMETHMH